MRKGLSMTTLPQPHRTRGHRPGYRPTELDDINICIHATPDVDAEVWRAIHADLDAAIDYSLKKYRLAAVHSAITSAGTTSDAIAYRPRGPAVLHQERPPEQEGFR
jgi:hypothetical protein